MKKAFQILNRTRPKRLPRLPQDALLSHVIPSLIHQSNLGLRRLISVTAIALAITGSEAAVTFELTFSDVLNHTGQNWDDPVFGPGARSGLQTALDAFGGVLPETAVIKLSITSSFTTAYFASTQIAAYQFDPVSDVYDGSVYLKIVDGIDINGAAPDGSIDYSFNLDGLHYADLNFDGKINIYDFSLNLRGLTRHELLHLLGMTSFVYPGSTGYFTRHDSFLFDSKAQPFVIEDGTLSPVADLNDPYAYFNAAEGHHYPIASPGDYSHLNGIMYPYRTEISDDDLNYLATLGYFPPGKLANISTRSRVETGDNVLIAGFIISGTSDKKVIIRAIGPSLTGMSVPDALQDPILELHDESGETIVTNDNWRRNQESEIMATGIPPSHDLESAVVETLSPGAYTAVVQGVGDATGVGLVEVYDLDSTGDSTLVNISTRGVVGAEDDVMIAGVIELGQLPSEVLIRVIGPSLPVDGRLLDPTVELHDSNGATLATNDNWKDSQQSAIEDTTLAPTSDDESTILATLAPGSYTAVVRGKSDATGVALVEVYRLE